MYSKKQLKAVRAAVDCARSVTDEVCSTGVLQFEEVAIWKLIYDLTTMSIVISKMIDEEGRPDV